GRSPRSPRGNDPRRPGDSASGAAAPDRRRPLRESQTAAVPRSAVTSASPQSTLDRHAVFIPVIGLQHESCAALVRRLYMRTSFQTYLKLLLRTCALTAPFLLAVAAPAGVAKLHGNNFYANCRFSHTN